MGQRRGTASAVKDGCSKSVGANIRPRKGQRLCAAAADQERRVDGDDIGGTGVGVVNGAATCGAGEIELAVIQSQTGCRSRTQGESAQKGAAAEPDGTVRRGAVDKAGNAQSSGCGDADPDGTLKIVVERAQGHRVAIIDNEAASAGDGAVDDLGLVARDDRNERAIIECDRSVGIER